MNPKSPDLPETPPPASQAPRKAPYLLISLAVLALDMWSKWLVESHLSLYASFEVIPKLLNFTHVQNTGVAFGLFASHGESGGAWILAILGLGALAFVGVYFHQTPASDRILLIALVLVMGGAVGNLLDRIVQGAVTDFIDFYIGTYHWHTFNVADSAITIGIALMILGTFRSSSPQDEKDRNEAALDAEADRAVADG